METLRAAVQGVVAELRTWQENNVVPCQQAAFSVIVQRLSVAATAPASAAAAAGAGAAPPTISAATRAQAVGAMLAVPDESTQEEHTQPALTTSIEPETPANAQDCAAVMSVTEPVEQEEPPAVASVSTTMRTAAADVATAAPASNSAGTDTQDTHTSLSSPSTVEQEPAVIGVMVQPHDATSRERSHLDWSASETQSTQAVGTEDSQAPASKDWSQGRRSSSRIRKTVKVYDPDAEAARPQWNQKEKDD